MDERLSGFSKNNWNVSRFLIINNIFSIFQYAQETQHEKILRGLAVGIALTMFNRLEESDALVTSLSTDKDPVLRRSGMYTIAMAYCGTGNNQAIRKLLHVAVSISLNSQKASFNSPLFRSFNLSSEQFCMFYIHTLPFFHFLLLPLHIDVIKKRFPT